MAAHGNQTSQDRAAALAEAELTIDLAAIAGNYQTLSEKAGPAACAPVVKADAYGTGLAPVAAALANAGAKTFFVAHVAEGVALRKILSEENVDAEIYIFSGVEPSRELTFYDNELTPVLNSLEQVARWSAFAIANSKALGAALHVDTGINRLGLEVQEVKAIQSSPEHLKGLDLKLVMSHLACADTPEHPLNRRQLERFNAARAALPPAPASLANSAGIFLGADFHFDVVRPGIGLYGGNPFSAQDNPMRPVVSLKAPILQIRTVPAGETVGYGASFTTQRTTRLAVLSLGYADGFLRAIGDGANLWVGDRQVSLLGRVSMDLIAIDVTDIPEAQLKAGDRIEVFGKNTTLDDLAAAGGTLAYELLANLGKRLDRTYIA